MLLAAEGQSRRRPLMMVFTFTKRAPIGRRVGIDTFTNGKEEESNAKLNIP